jgi:hypothetical protein
MAVAVLISKKLSLLVQYLVPDDFLDPDLPQVGEQMCRAAEQLLMMIRESIGQAMEGQCAGVCARRLPGPRPATGGRHMVFFAVDVCSVDRICHLDQMVLVQTISWTQTCLEWVAHTRWLLCCLLL